MSTQNPNEEMVVSYLTIRRAVGWLGMLLPFALLSGNFFVNRVDIMNNPWFIETDCHTPYVSDGSFKDSISHYYYSTVGELFTGTLCAVALFMFSYKGHPKRPGEKGLSDSLMTNLAGIFALGVVVFPTSSEGCISDNMRIFLSSPNTGIIHFSFAALFFITLAFMSIINFRRTNQIATFGTGTFNKLYLACGIIMLACLLIIFIYSKFLEENYPALNELHIVFVFETVALLAFGLSWLTKGRIDFNFVLRQLKLTK